MGSVCVFQLFWVIDAYMLNVLLGFMLWNEVEELHLVFLYRCSLDFDVVV